MRRCKMLISSRELLMCSCVFVAMFRSSHETLRNAVVVEGERFQLSCSHNRTSTVEWSFWPVGKEQKDSKVVPPHDERTSGKFIQSGPEHTNIIFNSIAKSDAGTYQCEVLTTVESKQTTNSITMTSHLVVLASNPVCELTRYEKCDRITVSENDRIQFRCTVDYTGNLQPVMEWRMNGTESIQADATTGSNSLTSELKILANVNDLGYRYSCTTRFKARSDTEIVSADNIPDYSHTWMAPEIDILYAPRNVQIFPQKTDFTSDEWMTCSADANPPTNYTWKIHGTDVTMKIGKMVMLSELSIRARSQLVVECVAANKFGFMTASASINIIRASTNSANTVVIFCVLSASLLTIFGLGSYIVWLKRTKGNYEHPTVKIPIEPQPIEDYSEIVFSDDETHSYNHQGTTELEIPAEYKQGDPNPPEIQNCLNVNNRGYEDYANYLCIVNKI